jgi:hypothetical protein
MLHIVGLFIVPRDVLLNGLWLCAPILDRKLVCEVAVLLQGNRFRNFRLLLIE